MGVWFGIKHDVRRRPVHNQALEEAWKKGTDVGTLPLAGGLTFRQAERWMRQRTRASKPSKLEKFCETFWRWLFYLTAHVVGVYIVWGKPWFWNIRHCFYGYPHHFLGQHYFYYENHSNGYGRHSEQPTKNQLIFLVL